MGRQIIRQPDGKYALWDSGVDHFAVVDASLEEIVESEVQRAAEETRRYWQAAAERARQHGTSGMYQFTMTWDKCLEYVSSVHGADEAEAVSRLEFSKSERFKEAGALKESSE